MRYYDIYICYDRYYYCPRLLLKGMKEVKSKNDEIIYKPLTPEEMFEDVTAEKAN